MNDIKNSDYKLNIFVTVKMPTEEMCINAKIRIYPVRIYLLNVNNENFRTTCVICSKLTKKDTETTLDIKKY